VANGTLKFAVITRDALDSLEERHARQSVRELLRSQAVPACTRHQPASAPTKVEAETEGA
jgi:hypothetical protein